MRSAGLLLGCAVCASAHVISMSTGWATLNGNRVEYIVRMPKYEMPKGRDPARLLFSHIGFASGFETARLLDGECHDDPDGVNYLCAANYAFAAAPGKLGVDCTFYKVTVPNHIHLLHAERAGKSDQAILDSSFSSATLAFRPPTQAEIVAAEAGSGAMRVWTSGAQLLLLAAVALAARSVGEALAMGLALIAGQWAATAFILRESWQPSPRFAEAAAALCLAYLALEILAFPESRGRWFLALIFGAFDGMYFAVFVGDSGYRFGYVLSGAAVAVLTVLAAGALLNRLVRRSAILLKSAAAGLLATGTVWFVVRLRG